MTHDCVVIGGGIVGLSVAYHLLLEQPGVRVAIVEKEVDIASHQSGRNSGVIHSGLYYQPRSLKARLARKGNRSMIAFCREHGVAHELCGKIVVATSEEELPLLENLYRRGIENELEVSRLNAAEAKELEPHINCLAAIRVASTAITDFRQVCARLNHLIEEYGGRISRDTQVKKITAKSCGYCLETNRADIETDYLINCAGLQSDRVARESGFDLNVKIVPFRGEYYELIPERRYLVNSLIYPVPHPAFPFLGVHFTKTIDGSVHAGPNAVLALKREGYRKSDFNLRDAVEIATYRGMWKLARKYYREGLEEIWRSLSKAAFVRSLRRIIPEVTASDLIPSRAGVRAQALAPDGSLVSDFLLLHERNAIHVANAPSPAATASLEIGKEVVRQIPSLRRTVTVAVTDAISSAV